MSNSENAMKIETYWDKHDIPVVSLTEFNRQIELSLQTNQKRGVITGISEAGMGKSQSIHAIAIKYGYRVVDIRTAQFGLIGAGVPQRANAETNTFEIAVPADFPKPGEKCIMLFDEINQGLSHAIAMFFRLLEDRGMYNYKLPDETIVVALMNPNNKGYSVTNIESNAALNRRMMKMYIMTTFAEWLTHARTDEFHYDMKLPCHPMVRKFLEAKPNLLYDTKSRDGGKQFACPASWETVSLSLYNIEKSDSELKKISKGIEEKKIAYLKIASDFTEHRIAASINAVTAKLFMQFIRDNAILISPEEILFKYTEKSALRTRVLELIQTSSGEVVDLCDTLTSHLFMDKPKVDQVAEKLSLFWNDLPSELAQSFYQQFGAACKGAVGGTKEQNVEYMKSLTATMRTYPAWTKMVSRLNLAMSSYETGNKEKKDPMLPGTKKTPPSA